MQLTATIAVLVLAGTLARSSMPAEEPSEEPSEVHIWNYDRVDPKCERWTDGCVSCNRADALTPCSNTGWGCTPSAIVCTKRAE
jgi:hypothetical protein